MQGLGCDRCNATLLLDSDVRYLVRIDVYAAYDPLEVTRDDLERDFESEMRALIASMEERDPDELQDEVHRRFEFDLCPACQKRFLADPLGKERDHLEGDES